MKTNEVIEMLNSGEIQMTEDVTCMAGLVRMVLSNAKDKDDITTCIALADVAIEMLDAWMESLESGGDMPQMSEEAQSVLSEIVKASKPVLAT